MAGAQVAAAPLAAAELREQGPGRVSVSGALLFGTARAAHELGCRLIAAAGGEVHFDCSALARADSAGVAVLLDWLAAARAQGKRLHYDGLPESVRAIARISEVEELLESGV